MTAEKAGCLISPNTCDKCHRQDLGTHWIMILDAEQFPAHAVGTHDIDRTSQSNVTLTTKEPS